MCVQCSCFVFRMRTTQSRSRTKTCFWMRYAARLVVGSGLDMASTSQAITLVCNRCQVGMSSHVPSRVRVSCVMAERRTRSSDLHLHTPNRDPDYLGSLVPLINGRNEESRRAHRGQRDLEACAQPNSTTTKSIKACVTVASPYRRR